MNFSYRRLTISLLLRFTAALVLVSMMLLAAAPPTYAQVDRAALEGTVSDPSGGVIVGASVKAVAVDTGLTEEEQTNSRGYYRISGLAVGGYTMTVTNAGFRTKVEEDVILRVGQTRTLDVQLGVGAINEQIEVKASTGPADRSAAEASTVIDTEQISELPNNGCDWASFTLLAPFAQDDGGGDLALTKVTKLTEQAEVVFGVQAFNIFNHVQLGDPGTLFLNYTPGQTPSNLSDPGNFGVITSIVNFNNNNDNAASPNTGTGLPRQLQLMVRVRF